MCNDNSEAQGYEPQMKQMVKVKYHNLTKSFNTKKTFLIKKKFGKVNIINLTRKVAETIHMFNFLIFILIAYFVFYFLPSALTLCQYWSLQFPCSMSFRIHFGFP